MNKTKLAAIVSVAEIISSLAIVVSLIYVAYEFRRTDTLTNRDVENIIYNRMLQMDQLIIENPDLAEIIIKAANDSSKILPAEEKRYLAFEHIFYDGWESAWYYYQEDVLDKKFWDSWNSWFTDEAKRRPALGWQGNRKNYSGAFLAYVDRILKDKQRSN